MLAQRTNAKHPLSKLSIWQLLNLEPVLLCLIILLSLCGIGILYSASSGDHAMVVRQSIRLIASFGVLITFAQIPMHKYQRFIPYLFYLCTGLLVMVLLIGKIGKGAQRWIDVGIFRFQPSELMKLIMPMMLAWHFSQQAIPCSNKTLAIAIALLFFPALLIAKQPDLGTAIMVFFSGAGVLFFSGIRYRLISSLLGLCAIITPFLWHFLHDYQKLRVLNFFNPERDPLGSGYHIIQSKIAIGSGGLMGKGYLNGTQSHLHFLPEHATDFIFAVLGEELGLIGTMFIIALITLITYRALYIANATNNTFAKLAGMGIAMNFFLSAFINMGMVTGLLPVVGVPLPLISYGGSSMLVLFANFGILMSIYAERHLFNKLR